MDICKSNLGDNDSKLVHKKKKIATKNSSFALVFTILSLEVYLRQLACIYWTSLSQIMTLGVDFKVSCSQFYFFVNQISKIGDFQVKILMGICK